MTMCYIDIQESETSGTRFFILVPLNYDSYYLIKMLQLFIDCI